MKTRALLNCPKPAKSFLYISYKKYRKQSSENWWVRMVSRTYPGLSPDSQGTKRKVRQRRACVSGAILGGRRRWNRSVRCRRSISLTPSPRPQRSCRSEASTFGSLVQRPAFTTYFRFAPFRTSTGTGNKELKVKHIRKIPPSHPVGRGTQLSSFCHIHAKGRKCTRKQFLQETGNGSKQKKHTKKEKVKGKLGQKMKDGQKGWYDSVRHG